MTMKTERREDAGGEPGPIAGAVEEVAGEKLGLEPWERPAIFCEAAAAATDDGLAYWAVLVLSGAIAALGLAMNSSAVVIGAMLVAPLLAPVMGLAMALAVGDGRLAIQTGAVVVGSTAAVIATGALVTVILPFHSITLEISARTRPSTLDLAVAVFSGLVAALVTVTRRSRLSAAIPGVAIAVALIPPLAVAGYGVGAGFNWRLIQGSMLLYGANLAGIVLSGMAVFLVVGMQREPVVAAARTWHEEATPAGLAGWIDGFRSVRATGVMRSPWARIGMVVAFVAIMAVPLSQTLRQLAREARVRTAVEEAVGIFEVPDRSSIINRQVEFGERRTEVYLRVATREWFGEEERSRFEQEATLVAGEPVGLVLEQLPATVGDVADLAALLPRARDVTTEAPRPSGWHVSQLLASARVRLQPAVGALPLPDGVTVVGTEVMAGEAGPATVLVAYAAPDPLPFEARQILERHLAHALGEPSLRVELFHVDAPPLPLGTTTPDTIRLAEMAALAGRFPRLHAELVRAMDADTAQLRRAMERVRAAGLEPAAVMADSGAELRLRLRVEGREEGR
jgi:uncharacterized hydrophobic protein (TIGR00271 family)